MGRAPPAARIGMVGGGVGAGGEAVRGAFPPSVASATTSTSTGTMGAKRFCRKTKQSKQDTQGRQTDVH